MIVVYTGQTNNIIYYSRYSEIDKYEIFDHNSRLVFSGETMILGYNGKINHSGLTYEFSKDNIYTYKSYYKYNDVYYLANHSYLTTLNSNDLINNYKYPNTSKNTFKTNGK